MLVTRCGRVVGGGIRGGPGGVGSGLDVLSGVVETGGHGARVRDDDGGGVGKPLLAPPE